MRIGKSEKTLLSLMLNHPNLEESALQILLQLSTGKKQRLPRLLSTLREKNLVEKNRLATTSKGNAVIALPEDHIDKEITGEIELVNRSFKLGKGAKVFLYILAKIDRASLQFLATGSKETIKNTFAVLKRLEESHLVYGYASKIPYRNARGRRYRPKYYGITKLGRLLVQVKFDKLSEFGKIDKLLENTENALVGMKESFRSTKT